MTRQAWVTVVALVSVVESLTTTDLFTPVAGDVKLQRPSWSNWTYCYDFLFGGHRMYQFRVGLNGFIIFRNLDASTYADIKAFYAHVDNTTFDVWYRETTDQTTLSLLDHQIHDASSTLYENFTAANALIFTWNKTGFSHLHNLSRSDSGWNSRNTFQVVVVSDAAGTESFVILSYLKLQWAIRLGSSDDDKFALARFDLPNSKFYHLPESKTADVVNLANSSNTGTPGRWVYRISGKTIQSGVRGVFTGSVSDGCTELLSCESIDVDMRGDCYCPTKRIAHGSSCTQDVCLAGLACGASTQMCECADTVTTYFSDATDRCLRKGGCGADCTSNDTCLSQSHLHCNQSKCTNNKCEQLQAVGNCLFADTQDKDLLVSALRIFDNTINNNTQMFYAETLYEWKANMAELNLSRLQTELNEIAAVVAINTAINDAINNAMTDAQKDNIIRLMRQSTIFNHSDIITSIVSREGYITKLKALKNNKTDKNVLLTRAEIIDGVQSVNKAKPTEAPRPNPDSNMDENPPKEDTNTGSVSSGLSNLEWFWIGVAILAVLAIVGGAMYHSKFCKGCACCKKKQQAAPPPPQAPPAATSQKSGNDPSAGSDKGNQSPGSDGAGVEQHVDSAGAHGTNERKSVDAAGRPTNSSNKRQSVASAGSNKKNRRQSVDSAGTNRTSTTVSSYSSEQTGSSLSSGGTYSSSSVESGSSSSGSNSTKS